MSFPGQHCYGFRLCFSRMLFTHISRIAFLIFSGTHIQLSAVVISRWQNLADAHKFSLIFCSASRSVILNLPAISSARS